MNLKNNFNSLENFLFYGFIIVFLNLILLILFTNFISSEAIEIKLRSVLLLVILFLIIIFYVLDKERNKIPILEIHISYFCIVSSLHGLFLRNIEIFRLNNIDSFIVSDELVIESLNITLLYIITLIFFFFFFKYVMKKNSNLYLKKSKNQITKFHSIIFFIIVIFYIFQKKDDTEILNQLIFPILIFSSLIFYYNYLISDNKIYKVFNIVPIIIIFFHFLLNFTLLNTILVILSMIILEINIKNKLNYFLIFLIIILPISISKIKNEFRYYVQDNYLISETENNNYQNQSLIEKFYALSNFYDQYDSYEFNKEITRKIEEIKNIEAKSPFNFMPTKGNLIPKSSLDFYLNRITENNFNLIKMLHYKDDQYLFINGRSINYIFVNLIPRIFWSNKPSASFGNEFGQKFRHLSKKNIST